MNLSSKAVAVIGAIALGAAAPAIAQNTADPTAKEEDYEIPWGLLGMLGLAGLLGLKRRHGDRPLAGTTTRPPSR